MNIRANTPVSFGAIRTPFGYCNQTQRASNVIDKIKKEFHPNGISAPNYNAMFFRKKTDEIKAAEYLDKAKLPYVRSELADIVDQDTRFEWATTGDTMILNGWYRRSLNK